MIAPVTQKALYYPFGRILVRGEMSTVEELRLWPGDFKRRQFNGGAAGIDNEYAHLCRDFPVLVESIHWFSGSGAV